MGVKLPWYFRDVKMTKNTDGGYDLNFRISKSIALVLGLKMMIMNAADFVLHKVRRV